MKINNHSEPIKLYDHISQIIVDPLSEEEKAERKSKKKKLERATKKNKNKYWNQNEMKALINECDNRKDNKIVCFTEDDQKIFFSIDYYIIQILLYIHNIVFHHFQNIVNNVQDMILR